mgnify:CR=1
MGITDSEAPASYGAIYRTGEFVQKGNVLGLSPNHKSVVVAPISGWVRLLGEEETPALPLRVEIWLSPTFGEEADFLVEVAR